jgi:hypothetical protein
MNAGIGGGAGMSASGPTNYGIPALSKFTPAVDEDVEFKKKSKDELWKESMDVAKNHGIGAAAEAMNAYLDRDQAKQAEDNDYGKHMAVFSAAMKGLAAASQGGANFGGSMAALGTELSDKLMANKDKMDAAERELAKTRFAVSSSVENQNLGEFHAALADYRDAQKLHQQAVQNAGQIGVEAQRNWVMYNTERAKAMAMLANRPGAAINAAQEDLRQAMASGNKDRITRARQSLELLQTLEPAVIASRQRGEDAQELLDQKMAGANPMLPMLIYKRPQTQPGTPEYAALDRQVQDMSRGIGGLGGGMFDPSMFDPGKANSILGR